MKYNYLKAILAVAIAFQISMLAGMAQEPMTAGAAKLLLDVNRANARKPLQALQEKYEAALSRLEKAQQSKGNLDALLLLKKEKENFRTRTEPPEPSTLPALNHLRDIYQRGLEPVEERQQRAEIAAFTSFKADLERLIIQLTRDGNVEEALKSREMLLKVEQEFPAPVESENSGEEIIVGEEENFVTTSQLNLTKQESLYVISSEAKSGQAIQSKRTFKTPFTIQARAMTDGGNVRFYFGERGIVIFNWEMKPTELRVHEPVGSRKHGIRDSRPLDPDRIYDLEIQVTESKIGIYVGKRKYGEVDGDFAKAEGIVGIGPAFGSKLSIERFAVTQP